jgi:uncharacterized membrane protein required for colicin V production
LKELIDHIPFLDTIIVGLVVLFIYLGWNHGLPKLAMVLGSLYTGFLLASIYYHLFAAWLTRTFKLASPLVADLGSFLLLNLFVTVLMVALLFSLFGHVQIKGRLAIFDKVGGTLGGVAAAALIAVIFVTVLRVPAETDRAKEVHGQVPAMSLFDDGYTRSFFAPLSAKAAPYLLSSVAPMLPGQAKANGAAPLLEPMKEVAVEPVSTEQ